MLESVNWVIAPVVLVGGGGCAFGDGVVGFGWVGLCWSHRRKCTR